MKPSAKRLLILASAATVGVVAVKIFLALPHSSSPAHLQSTTNNPPKPTAKNSSPSSPAGTPNLPDFQSRPFAVAHESSTAQWTAADGKDTNVIRRLAHNELEYQRLVEENSRIHRRQLVYRKDTAAAVMQRARLSGEPIRQLTLPGLDGQEFQFAVERADLEPSKQSGTFAGRLVGEPDSMVTLAFQFGREAFTVLSPARRIFLQASPREPGELIIASFDPDTYLPLPGGEPIVTTNTFKVAQ